MKTNLHVIPIVVGVTCLFGCARYSAEEAHSAFVANLQGYIGRDIHDPYLPALKPDYELSVRTLSSGLKEYRYASDKRHVGCVTVLQVDPKSDKIVAADYEGSSSDCSIPR